MTVTVLELPFTPAPEPTRQPGECIDCWADGRRGKPLAAPHPGPRCHRHQQARKRAVRASRADSHVQRAYGLTPEQYEELWAAQGRCCAWCRLKTGTTKRLCVDHDHSCCPGPTCCGECVRGLLCTMCNRMLGHLRNDPAAVERGAAYLRQPPARAVLGGAVRAEIA